MDQKRVEAWFAKELEDDELTNEEIKWLERAVFNAVARKVLEREGVHTFPASKEIH